MDKFSRKRVEILKCAAAVFRRRGYYGSSLESIARAARIKKSNLYYYFKDKRQILFFWHEYSMDLLLETLQRPEMVNGSPAEQLHRLITAIIHVSLDDLGGAASTMNLEALTATQYAKIAAKRDKISGHVTQIIEAGMDQGDFQPGNAKLVAFAMLGAINWIPVWFNSRGAATSKDVARTFADYLVGHLTKSTDPAEIPADFAGVSQSPTITRRQQ